jgi:hypothetical protein
MSYAAAADATAHVLSNPKKPKEVHYKNAVCSSTTILSPVCHEMFASRSAIFLSLFLFFFFFFSCKSQDTKFLFCLPILIPQRKPGRICLDQIQMRLCAYVFVENPAI